jgi:hypothetical protein
MENAHGHRVGLTLSSTRIRCGYVEVMIHPDRHRSTDVERYEPDPRSRAPASAAA